MTDGLSSSVAVAAPLHQESDDRISTSSADFTAPVLKTSNRPETPESQQVWLGGGHWSGIVSLFFAGSAMVVSRIVR